MNFQSDRTYVQDWTQVLFTASFNNMRTLKFKAQPTTDAFFATVNGMFGGSSHLPTTIEAVVKSIIVHSSDIETVLDSSRKLGGPAEHLIDGSEKRICRSIFEFFESTCYWKAQLSAHLEYYRFLWKYCF